MSDPLISRDDLVAEEGLVNRQQLDLLEIWEDDSKGNYFAFVPSEEDDREGCLHELGPGDFEAAAYELQDALVFTEVLQLLPQARKDYFAAVILRQTNKGTRRRGLTIAQAIA